MAVHYRDLKRKQSKKFDKKQDKRQQFRAVITDALGNQTGAGDIWFNRLQRKVWAMPNGGTQPFPYNCFRIKPNIGLGVIIGYSSPLNQLVEVLQTDTEFLGPSNTTGTAYEAPDNEDFLPGGRLQLWLDTRLIQSLAIYPNSTGLLVNMTNGDYIYQNERKTFDGEENKDLSASAPGAGLHRYVGLYLDSSNLLQTVNGATIALASTPAEPTWPAGSYRLGMVRINATQTSFSMADDIVNLKIPWTDEESFSGAWPAPGEIKIGETVHASLAAAQAAAVSPGVVKLGEGSYPCNNLTFATGVSLASAGNATITQATDANCLTLTNATIRDISFSVSINSANTRSTLTFVDTCYAYNVRIAGSNAGAGVVDGFAYADTDEVYLGDCEAIVDGDAVNINNSNAIVTVANGTYEGGTGGIEVVAGRANLLFPHVPSDNVTAYSASRGQWFDSDAQIRLEVNAKTTPIDADKLPLGDSVVNSGLKWLTWANLKATLKSYFDGLYNELLVVKNTSGATRAAGDVGYVTRTSSSGIEFKTTTTASDDRIGSVAVVVVGGADNADIYVSQTGRYTIPYAGSAPAAGDFLVFSTTAGKVALQTTMSPDILAVAMAAGSGGTVDALLYSKTVEIPYTSANPLQESPVLVGDSTFIGTIATLPGGAVLTYNVTSGDENWLDAVSTTALAKLRLFNSTRGTYALISDTVTGTNTITLTANVPAGWATTDVITIRSQTNTDTSGGAYFLEYEITSEIPELARYIICDFAFADTAAAGQRGTVHPYAAFSLSKASFLNSQVANVITSRTVMIPLIQRRYTIRADASGAGTCLLNLYSMGYGIAAP